MQTITFAMDEALVRLTEAEAAKLGKTLSDFIGEAVVEKLGGAPMQNNRQLEALRRIFSQPLLPLSENGRLPDANERNARR